MQVNIHQKSLFLSPSCLRTRALIHYTYNINKMTNCEQEGHQKVMINFRAQLCGGLRFWNSCAAEKGQPATNHGGVLAERQRRRCWGLHLDFVKLARGASSHHKAEQMLSWTTSFHCYVNSSPCPAS